MPGQRRRDERGARGHFGLHPAHAGSGRRERKTEIQLLGSSSEDGLWFSPGGLWQGWGGRDGDGSTSSSALGTNHPRPNCSQDFYFNKPHLLIRNVEGSEGQTQDQPRSLGQLVKIFLQKQTAAIGLSSPSTATNALLRAPSSLPPKPPQQTNLLLAPCSSIR